MHYLDFGTWLSRHISGKVQKISVNAGFSCPNRDGKVGFGGCTYCNNQTFNPSYCETDKSVTVQLEEGKAFFSRKYKDMRYLAYFQAYTNTYGSIEHLVSLYEEALSVEGVIGIVIGTRPDCMPGELLDYLEELSKRVFVLVEYGIESVDDDVLKMINRGHDFACVEDAVSRTHARGIYTGGHVILGLPLKASETGDLEAYKRRLVAEACKIARLPLDTLKIHQLQLIRGTVMARQYETNPERFCLFNAEEYIRIVSEYIRLLPPALAIERFVSQSPSNLLAVPGWGLKNYEFVEKIRKYLDENDIFQGDLYKIDA